jgi:hypothetical protein
MILLSLLLLVCFRRRKNKARRELGRESRGNYHSTNLDSPGSQSPIGAQYIGERVQANLTPFVPPTHPTHPNNALAYYGDDSRSSVQKTQSPHPSSLRSFSQYQARPEDRPHSQGSGWSPGYAYPPPSPSVYPLSIYQGMTSSTDQRSSTHSGGVVTPPPHFDPRPMSTPQTSTYDTGSRPSTYAVQNPAPPRGGEGNALASAVTAADWKQAEARRQARESQSAGQSSRPVSSATTSLSPRPVTAVFQHQDSGNVVELPPAYREYLVSPTSPPPP